VFYGKETHAKSRFFQFSFAGVKPKHAQFYWCNLDCNEYVAQRVLLKYISTLALFLGLQEL
jgi:hypothetical protein